MRSRLSVAGMPKKYGFYDKNGGACTASESYILPKCCQRTAQKIIKHQHLFAVNLSRASESDAGQPVF